MIRADILKLIGGGNASNCDYTPVACLLNSGYGCVGYFNTSVNENLTDMIVLLNMRLVDLRTEDGHPRRGRVADFNDFLQDVVVQHIQAEVEGASAHDLPVDESLNPAIPHTTVPLTAIPLSEISLLYPVARITKLLRGAQQVANADPPVPSTEVPTFLDFNHKSIVLKVLRTRLW